MRLPLAVGCALLLAGCVDLSVPDDVLIRCTSTDECPGNMVCRPGPSVCVDPDADEIPFPTVSAVFIQPPVARPGTRVRLSFRVNGDAAAPPTALATSNEVGANESGQLLFTREPDENGAFVFTLDLPEDAAEGLHSVIIGLTDAYGVEDDVNVGTLSVDGTPPSLLAPATVAPAVAGPGATAVVRLVANEALTDQVVLDVDDGLTISTRPALNNDAGVVTFTVEVPFDAAFEQLTFTVRDLVDLAGNATPGPLAAGELLIDAAPPSITDLALNRDRFSRQTGFNDLALTFRAEGAASVTAEVFGRSLDCAADEAPDGYRCTTTLDEDDPEGASDIVVRALDDVGNPSAAFASFTLDTTPPQVVASSLDVRLFPGDGNPLDEVDAVTVGTTVLTTFTTDEPLGALPALGPAGLHDFPLTETVGQTSTFTWTYAGGLGEGPLVLEAVLTDEVGNGQTASLGASGTITIDTTAPSAPQTDVDRAVTLTRRPWGGIDGEGVLTAVQGAPDAAPDADVVVVTNALGEVLGQSDVEEDGSFDTVTFPGVDLKTLWVSGADSAGNRSASAAIRDVALVATLEGREPRSDTGNPHQVRAVRDLLDALIQPDTEPELAGDAFARDDGEREVVSSSSAWRRPGSTGNPPVRPGMAVWDSVRDRSVVLGGVLSGGNVLSFRHDEWAGAGWTSLSSVLDLLPPRRVHAALGFNDKEGRVVLATGRADGDELLSDTWIFEGDAWVPQLQTGALGPREHAAMAYDSRRGVMVLVGGDDGTGPLDETWELTGDGWILRDDVGGPGPRERHALVYDPVREALVLVGGDDGMGATADLWVYDGAAWSPLVTTAAGAPIAPLLEPRAAWDGQRDELLILSTDSADAWTLAGSDVTHHPDATDAIPAFPQKGIVATGGAPLVHRSLTTYRWTGDGLEDITRSSPGNRGRGLHAMTFDHARDEAVLFGGYGSAAEPYEGTALDDVYTWTEDEGWVVPATQDDGPSGRPHWRTGHAMVFDAAREVTVMFGGFISRDDGAGANLFSDDTWLWDGATWTLADTGGNNPSPRTGHRMVYDSALDEVVLYGGLSPQAEILTDMWRWDGASWTEVPNNGLKPIVQAFDMVYDTDRARIVLFGGEILLEESKPLTTADLWLYNAASNVWERRINIPDPELDGQPIPRAHHRMVYDEARGETQMLGGIESSNYESAIPSVPDAWAWNGTSWRRLDVGNSEPIKVPSYLRNYQLTWDTVNDAALLIGDESIWTVSNAGKRPAAVASFFVGDVLKAGQPVDLSLSATAGGTGGVELLLWERPGVWRSLDDRGAPPDVPEALSGVGPIASKHLVNERVHVALRAKTPSTANTPSVVEVDALELRFRYTVTPP